MKIFDNMHSYDEDYNHEPCQRNGHRAHWAVISGTFKWLTGKEGCFEMT